MEALNSHCFKPPTAGQADTLTAKFSMLWHLTDDIVSKDNIKSLTDWERKSILKEVKNWDSDKAGIYA